MLTKEVHELTAKSDRESLHKKAQPQSIPERSAEDEWLDLIQALAIILHVHVGSRSMSHWRVCERTSSCCPVFSDRFKKPFMDILPFLITFFSPYVLLRLDGHFAFVNQPDKNSTDLKEVEYIKSWREKWTKAKAGR